ncbi:MAG: 30S ribosomal protein S6--L-glutamate ligase [Candidatus Saccharibacteria bacterium]|nr:30S ribosomal protein S6--L-glutamate ligase [Candidatus Saccharibacteria bacterium]
MKIGILTRVPGYTTGRLKHEARIRGHEAVNIKFPECYIELESDNPTTHYRGEELNDFDVIIPRIMPDMSQYGTTVLRQFEMMGVYTPLRSIAITRARDKLRATQLLSKSHIGIPKTIFASETSDVDDLIAQIGGAPLIVKLANGTQGNGVVLAETNKAAKSVIQAFYVTNTPILIQEFIAESAGTDIRAFVVGNRVVASMKRQSLDDDFRSNIHQGGSGSIIKLTDEEKSVAVKAAKAMGLPICGVDLMRTNRGPMVLEVNPTPGLEGIETVTGRNVAGKIIEYVEHNASRKNSKDKIGA